MWSVKVDSKGLKEVVQKLTDYGNNMCLARGAIFEIRNRVNDFNILSDERCYAAFLCMKEAINNAVKYSGASHIILPVSLLKSKIEFIVSDNGSGFDVNTAKAGNGLRNMQERAAETGALFYLNSIAGKVSEIKLQFKIPQ